MEMQKYDIEDAARQWGLDVEKTKDGYIISNQETGVCFVRKSGFRYEIYDGSRKIGKPKYVVSYVYEAGLKALSLLR